jgi:hypothetical protein
VDSVDDVREISGTSRFLSGGIGGITSQLSESLIAMRGIFVDLSGSRHIPNRNVENADDEQYRGPKTDTRFGCKAGLGIRWL